MVDEDVSVKIKITEEGSAQRSIKEMKDLKKSTDEATDSLKKQIAIVRRRKATEQERGEVGIRGKVPTTEAGRRRQAETIVKRQEQRKAIDEENKKRLGEEKALSDDRLGALMRQDREEKKIDGERKTQQREWRRNVLMGGLGIMFFGMAVKKSMEGLLQPAMDAVGIFDLMGSILTILFLPAALFLLENVLIPLLNWVGNMDDETKMLIGGIVLAILAIGTLAMVLGQLLLGIAAIAPFISAVMGGGLGAGVLGGAGAAAGTGGVAAGGAALGVLPILLIAAAVVAVLALLGLGNLIYDEKNPRGKGFREFGESTQDFFEGFSSPITDAIGALALFIGTGFAGLQQLIPDWTPPAAFLESLSATGQTIGMSADLLGGVVSGERDLFSGLYGIYQSASRGGAAIGYGITGGLLGVSPTGVTGGLTGFLEETIPGYSGLMDWVLGTEPYAGINQGRTTYQQSTNETNGDSVYIDSQNQYFSTPQQLNLGKTDIDYQGGLD